MKKTRVAVLASYFPTKDESHRGHSAYQTLRKMTDLADIEVVCTTAQYPKIGLLRPRGFVSRDVDLTWSPADVKSHYALYPTLPYIGRVLNGSACLQAAKPILDRIQPDLILNYWLYPEGWAAVEYARQRGIPSIVCSVGSDLRRVEDSWTRQATEWTVRNASHVLAVSHELREQALRFGADPNRATAILNGCDTSIFHLRDRQQLKQDLNLPPDRDFILYVGNLIPTKGLFELINAFAPVARRHAHLDLVLVGRGQSQEPLAARAAELGIAGRVRFTGVLPSAEVGRWMGAARFFTLPSYSEGCPNVVIEALASGRPVIASNVGGIPELVDSDSGVLVPARDAAALESALEQGLARSWDEHAISRKFDRN